MLSLTNTSLALYQYMCQSVVGTEKTVRTKRLLNITNDFTDYNDLIIRITSGSFGEGLEMQSSDVDLMNVLRCVNIYETLDNRIFDSEKTHFVMDMNDTKPGFSKLCFIRGSLQFFWSCIQKDGDLYLPNNFFVKNIKGGFRKKYNVVHGPCLSDEDGRFDHAFCFHCKSWITPAKEWIHRAQNEWPSENIKSYIVDYGVLIVPIGVKGSKNEEIEWRISFSFGEKLLIYSFSHTQLLCYALMKILLKGVIEKDIRCTNLLCSYFLKTIIFWVSEDLPLSVWKPENLITCFLKCFERLIYCVKHSTCPHYFITENNLFEQVINRKEWPVLVENLNILRSYGWRCLLMTEQLPQTVIELSTRPFITLGDSFEEYIIQILSSKTSKMFLSGTNYKKAIQTIISHRSNTVKFYWIHAISKAFCSLVQRLPISEKQRNKCAYTNYNTRLSHILLSINHDALSGWLMLASFFYKMKQYRLSLNILSYSLSKCTPEKNFDGTLSDEQYQFLNSCQYLGLQYTLKAIDKRCMIFEHNSLLIPDELELEVQNTVHAIPPVAFVHFLCFLCNYHLGDIRQYRKSLKNIYQTIITEQYFVTNLVHKAIAYNYLGIAYQLTGDSEAARQAFLEAVEHDTSLNASLKRLKMMDI